MHTERNLIDRFLEALGAVPDVQIAAEDVQREIRVNEHPHHRHLDARINVRVGDRPITLLVETKKAIYPRDVRQVLWQLRDLAQNAAPLDDGETQSMLVAESISPGAKDLLRAERVGYFDDGGSLFLPARGAYLYIDKPPPKSLEKSMRSIFAGRRAQVLLALLVRPQDWFGVTKIAREAKVAPSTASQVLTQLDRFEWVDSRGQGPGKERHLREPGALLDAWARQKTLLRPPAMRRYYVSGFKADSLLEHIARTFNGHHVTYAVTSEAAAQRYAPFLTTVSVVRARLLAGSAADAAVADLGARVVNEGFNFAVYESKSAGELLFREQLGEVWLASPVQVYLDLVQGEGRAKELADHLRRERIKF